MKITVVGLGPGGVDLLLPVARTAIAATVHRYVRTDRHPAVTELAAEGIVFESFDHVYERAGSYDDVYAEIVERLVAAAAEHGSVVFAVPGNPGVAERTVRALRDRSDVELVVVPGLSFVDLAWSRLGVDPMIDGALVVDAQSFTGLMPVPTLVGHLVDRMALSEAKLTLLERLEPGTPVTVLQRLGRPDEHVAVVALADLDRSGVVEPDHLTSIYVDGRTVTERSPVEALSRFLDLVEQLRGPGGCPWDAEQTHHSLRRHLLEETYEVLETIDALPADAPGGEGPIDPDAYDRLRDELGDLLYQVAFHATLAAETGLFGLAEVADGIHDKLVRRHPQVFATAPGDAVPHELGSGTGTVTATLDAQTADWERLKQAERVARDGPEASSAFADVPRALPALVYAAKMIKRARVSGGPISLPEGEQALATISERARAVVRHGDATALGELLAIVVAEARAHDLDPEGALREWSETLRALG